MKGALVEGAAQRLPACMSIHQPWLHAPPRPPPTHPHAASLLQVLTELFKKYPDQHEFLQVGRRTKGRSCQRVWVEGSRGGDRGPKHPTGYLKQMGGWWVVDAVHFCLLLSGGNADCGSTSSFGCKGRGHDSACVGRRGL